MTAWDITLEGISTTPLDETWAEGMLERLAAFAAAVSYRDRRFGISLALEAESIEKATQRVPALVDLLEPPARATAIQIAAAEDEAGLPSGAIGAAS